jgi:hypothetical protein
MNDFGAGICVGLAGLGTAVAAGSLWRRWTHRGTARVRLLARQYQAMTHSADGDISMDLLARPELINSRMEFRKLEAIEAELVNQADRLVAEKLLRPFFSLDDPWVKARAAKVLYPLNSRLSLTEIKKLVQSKSPFLQLPGIWALGQIATKDSIQLLASLVWSPEAEVQQAAIRCLVQMETKGQLPHESQEPIRRLLKEVRFKTDWIL